MIFVKICAKIMFLPLYLLLMITSIICYLINLAFNNQTLFDEILRSFGIDDYWEF